MSRTIAVLLPGRTASTLVGPGQPSGDGPDAVRPIVWPDAIERDLAAPAPREGAALAALERDDLLPGTLFGATSATQGYGPFLRYFEALGFATAVARYDGPGRPAPGWGLPADGPGRDLLVAFPYDWRRGCTTNAKLLRDLLATLQARHASPGDRLFLVGHSMGGLVARAYLEDVGTADAWRERIAGLVTLGTPHLGMPGTLAAITGQAQVPPLPGIDPAAVARLDRDFAVTARWDGTFELLPPPVLESAMEPPFTRYVQAGGAWYNLLDPALPAEVVRAAEAQAERGLSRPSRLREALEGAARFFGTLSYTGTVPGTPLPPYRCVVGITAGAPTVTALAYDDASRSLLPRLDDTGRGGDGVVPAWSAAFAGRTIPVAEVCTVSGVGHVQLPSAPEVIRQVAGWIAPRPAETLASR